jgi:hypothetical protein
METKDFRIKKHDAELLWKYEQANDGSDLFTFYDKPSAAKWAAYKHCLEDMEKHDGEHFRVITANTFTFTCGYVYINKEDNKQHLRYHTASNVYDFRIEE